MNDKFELPPPGQPVVLPPDWRSWPIEKKRELRRDLAARRGVQAPGRDDGPRLTREQAQAEIEAILHAGLLPPPSECE